MPQLFIAVAVFAAPNLAAGQWGSHSGVAPETPEPPVTFIFEVKLSPADVEVLRREVEVPEAIPTVVPEWERKIRNRLAEKIEIEFEGNPLEAVFEFMADFAGAGLSVDDRAVADLQVDLEQPIRMQFKDVTAAAILDRICEPLALGWTIEADSLVITSQNILEEKRVTRCYDVADLVLTRDRCGRLQRDYTGLIQMIQNSSSALWEEIDGSGGAIAVVDTVNLNALAIRNTAAAHREIARLLADLRTIARDDFPKALFDHPHGMPRFNNVGDPDKRGSAPPPLTYRDPNLFGKAAIPEPKPVPIPADERRVLRAVESKISLDGVEKPFREVIEQIGAATETRVVFDRRALDDIGQKLDEPVVLFAKDETARSVLTELLRPRDLVWTVRFGALYITSQAESEERRLLTTRIYDVSDLVLIRDEHGRLSHDFRQLIGCIQTGTSGSWVEIDGTGSEVSPLETVRHRVLAITTTRVGHEETERILAGLRSNSHRNLPATKPSRAIARPIVMPRNGDASDVTPAAQSLRSEFLSEVRIPAAHPVRIPAQEATIRKALQKRVSFSFLKQPLSQVIDEVEESLGVPVRTDKAALKDLGLALDETITFHCHKMTIESCLHHMLPPLELTWAIHNGRLRITSPQIAEEFMPTQTYDVVDLCYRRGPSGRIVRDVEPLIEAVQEATSGLWGDIDGSGGEFRGVVSETNASLVVRQTGMIHDQIRDLLAQIRRLKHDDLPPAPTLSASWASDCDEEYAPVSAE